MMKWITKLIRPVEKIKVFISKNKLYALLEWNNDYGDCPLISIEEKLALFQAGFLEDKYNYNSPWDKKFCHDFHVTSKLTNFMKGG